MQNYPGNSQKAASPTPPQPAEKKVERIVEGDVLRRKKPMGKRFAETFFGGAGPRDIWAYVVMDVLIPAARDMVAEGAREMVEMAIYPEGRSRRRAAKTYDDRYGRVNYHKSSTSVARREEPSRSISRAARARHDFDEIILPTRVEADEVLDQLFSLVSQYEQATVADLYTLVGVTSEFTDRSWGWTDLRGSNISRQRNGYLIDLPKPEPLDR